MRKVFGDRLAQARRDGACLPAAAWSAGALLFSVVLASGAQAIEWSVSVKDAKCLHENAEKYRRDLESPMLIFPEECPDTLASPLLGAQRAEAPDIQTSAEDEANGADAMIVLDEAEFSCFLRLYEEAYGVAQQQEEIGAAEAQAPDDGEEDEVMVFDTDACPVVQR
jgi:hypothetical protein